jgi:hypothetical protein
MEIGLAGGHDMRLSNHEEEFFRRLRDVNLSARDRAEIRLRSPRLADAIEEYQQKHVPTRPYVSDVKNILPGLHPHQAKSQEQAAALQRMGYSLDLESLKANNPWEANHLPAMLIIEQIRPHWASLLKSLALEKQRIRSQTKPIDGEPLNDHWNPFNDYSNDHM